MKHRSKAVIALSLAAALVWTAPAVVLPQHAAAASATAAISVLSPQAQEYAAYLQEKYSVSVGDSWTRGQFADALNAIAAPEKAVDLTGDASEPLKAIEAVALALKAADLEELAYTYPATKAKTALAWVKLGWTSEQYAADQAKILAAAVNTGFLVSSYYPEIRNDATASPSLAAVLLGKVLEAKGLYKRYIGYTTDADILVKLGDAYRTSDIIQAPELRKVVDEALKQNLVTGYNLKDSRYDANFLDSLSIVYGHSDFKHALQLIGLLRSENIKAKVQFEPKTSAFIYLKEWGDPGESELYEVVQIENGNYIEYAKEYDLALEFASEYDKDRFDRIILTYAKKNEDKQPGLIYGSWWQPLYYSLTELSGYKEISNNKISTGKYYAQSFSLKEQSADVTEGFKKIDPSANVVNYDFWVDGPFYNYLQGESK
ncbi:hypothetical protein B1A99_33060 [Cohnella sp. CIP 111063]|uniref:hypothetical protein n=1 Tax=unclassified Cohnella TaxID=2636738 RepID=UPI000B8C06A4|nr:MULTISPECIES: hypothetical protein [unclassified Cohnella]OXS52680.1 hypothetical protein B1A99_33060 [Cohnella sp. CIP 111063]PRX59212.1 hypothetical protein B0G52_13240 [Cohnella sp. SGD-V74]